MNFDTNSYIYIFFWTTNLNDLLHVLHCLAFTVEQIVSTSMALKGLSVEENNNAQLISRFNPTGRQADLCPGSRLEMKMKMFHNFNKRKVNARCQYPCNSGSERI